MDSLGLDTHLYKTYGTASTNLSIGLLSYSFESISFIVFHEATHRYIRSKAKIPYEIEEAACDIFGNYGSLEFFERDKNLKSRIAKRQLKIIEKIAKRINISLNDLESNKSKDFINSKTKLKKTILRFSQNGSEFISDRYNYELNNAYLLRNKNYSMYYFKLKKLLILMEDISIFIEYISNLPDNIEESIRKIDTKIEYLKMSLKK